MRKLRFAVPLIIALVFAQAPSHAATTSGTYVAAAAVSCGGGVCSPQASGQQVAPLGGFSVAVTAAAGGTVKIKISDALDPNVPFQWCQRHSAASPPGLCGQDPTDITGSSCSGPKNSERSIPNVKVTGSSGPVAGSTWGNLLIFIFASGSCSGTASSGTATITH